MILQYFGLVWPEVDHEPFSRYLLKKCEVRVLPIRYPENPRVHTRLMEGVVVDRL